MHGFRDATAWRASQHGRTLVTIVWRVAVALAITTLGARCDMGREHSAVLDVNVSGPTNDPPLQWDVLVGGVAKEPERAHHDLELTDYDGEDLTIVVWVDTLPAETVLVVQDTVRVGFYYELCASVWSSDGECRARSNCTKYRREGSVYSVALGDSVYYCYQRIREEEVSTRVD